MKQRRFWNWKDDDLTFDLSRAFIGLIDHGRYRGFNAAAFDATMNLTLVHEDTGTNRVKKDKTLSDRYGIVVTKQGVIIQEENTPTLVIDPTDASTFRKDLIVVEHVYEEVVGGQTAVYKVIKGADNSIDYPALTDANIQTIIGRLELPVGTSSLDNAGVVYTPEPQPGFANHVPYITQENGFFTTNLDARANRIINLENPIDGQDAATKFYVDQAIANNIVWATEAQRGIIEIATTAEAQAGTDDERAMTPKKTKEQIDSRIATQTETNDGTDDSKLLTPRKLNNRTSTETRTGIARIATEAEALAGVDDTTIITPFKLKKALPLIPIVLEIGEWDVQTNNSFGVPHGLSAADWVKIVGLSATLVKDDQTVHTDLSGEGGIALHIDSLKVGLEVDPASAFNSADYSQTGGFNRGWVVLWSKADVVAQTGLFVDAGIYQSLTSNFTQGSQSILFDLDGFINSIGSPVSSILWTIESAPAGSTSSFIDDSIEDAQLQVTHYGFYTLRMTVQNAAGDIAFDETTIEIVEQANNLPFIQSIKFFNPATSNSVGGYVQYNGTLNGAIKIKVHATDVDVTDILTASMVPTADGVPFGTFQISVNNGGTVSSNLVLPDPYTYAIDPVDPSIITISGFSPPLSGGGGDKVHFIAVIDDGNGGQDQMQIAFKNLGPNTVGQEGAIIPQLSMFFTGDTNALPNVYNGTLDIASVTSIAYLELVIRAPGVTVGSLEVIGGYGLQIFSVGTHIINSGITNSKNATLEILGSSSVTTAAMTVTAYNSAGTALGSVFVQVSNP